LQVENYCTGNQITSARAAMSCLQPKMETKKLFLAVVFTAVAAAAAQPDASTSTPSNTPTIQFQCQPFPTLAGIGE
jgi:hypothetical protein